jgi:hypothetical protein
MLIKNNIRKIILSMIGMLMVVSCNPNKVIDPNDTNFDPMEFRFEDYPSESKHKDDLTPFMIHEAYRVMFPVGTPKHRVDKILVEQAGATSKKSYKKEMNEHSIYYRKDKLTNLSAWILNVRYDNDFKLKNIKIGQKGWLYPKEGEE